MERAVVIKKAQEVEALAEKIQKATTIVAFDYAGLSVEAFTELRTALREAGCEVTVYKNNISRRASIASGYEALAETLVGSKALILSFEDIVSPAKIIAEFAKEHEVVTIGSGVIEGEVVGLETIMELASLPSKDTLLTQLAAGLLMPVRDLTIGLHMLTEEDQEEATE